MRKRPFLTHKLAGSKAAALDRPLRTAYISRMPISVRILVAIAVGSLASGCTWVTATPGGSVVRVAPAASVVRCRYLGQVTTSVLAKVAVIPRRASKVEEELLVLAKNEAAKMGGDTVVAAGAPSEGRQEFAVYRCEDDEDF